MRNRIALLAPALLLPIACHAAESDAVAFEKVSVPFDGLRPHANPGAPYNELIRRIERQAAADARDDRFAPVVSRHPAGPNGERMLIAAITPSKGVFYYAEHGPYGMRPGPTFIAARSRIEVCRFAIHWDRLSGGAYAPGIVWASLAFPDLSCTRPAVSDVSAAERWRRNAEGASYSVVARGAEAGLNGALVLERWPGDGAARQPFDGGKAVAAVVGEGERILRAIPVSADLEFYAETSGGRAFVGIAGSMGSVSSTRCLVEGLRWPDLSSTDGRRRSAATTLCRRLFDDYRAGLRPRPGEPYRG